MTVTINGATGIAGVNGSAALPAVQGDDTNTGVFYPAADTVAITTGGTERMRINASGQAEFTAGTAALPAITTTGDTNTGMFFPAADVVGIATGGVERIKVDSAGIVKIRGTGAAYDSTPGDGLSDAVYFQVDNAGVAHIDAYVNAGSTSLSFGNNSGGGAVTERMRLDISGNLLFNSGYGGIATAYGCRAWVNFDGTTNTAGFCTIRGSGNVTSVADNGTGDYTVNFTTAMPDANYSAQVWAASSGSTSAFGAAQSSIAAPTASALRFITRSPTPATVDVDRAQVSIFR